jgi:hypothetical protein
MEARRQLCRLPPVLLKVHVDRVSHVGDGGLQSGAKCFGDLPHCVTHCRKRSRDLAVASISCGNGKKSMRVAARVGVLPNDRSTGIDAEGDGADGVEWRRARNIKRYRR